MARRRPPPLGSYVEAARRLGTDHWREIEALVESALRSGRRELAVEVLRAAADRPGWHQRRLLERCLELTGVDLASGECGDPPPLALERSFSALQMANTRKPA